MPEYITKICLTCDEARAFELGGAEPLWVFFARMGVTLTPPSGPPPPEPDPARPDPTLEAQIETVEQQYRELDGRVRCMPL